MSSSRRAAGAKHGRPRGKRLHIRQSREHFTGRMRAAGLPGDRPVGDAPNWRLPRVKAHS